MILNRRRFLTISAAAAGLAASGARAASTRVWTGVALGARASIRLDHPEAGAIAARAAAEIARLEGIFSLYRADSALSRLNAEARLAAPPAELLECLTLAGTVHRASGGAFDPTVQPLWRLYADHFAAPDAPAAGPTREAIARVLRAVDYRKVQVGADRIRLHSPGMALTLNGVAQGYVTDRVIELLRAAGFDDVLVDLGEARVRGQRPGGGAWRAAIADPRREAGMLFELPLGEARGALPALATSAGAGTPIGPDPRINHLFDPHTGRSANRHLSVSVAAPRATLADGLSTTLAVLAPDRAGALLDAYPAVRAYLAGADGKVRVQGRG